MISYSYLAFLMGLFGSIHCVVMCGPLQFALQGNQKWSIQSMFNKVLYQCGRLVTYTTLGFLAGTLTFLSEWKGWQQYFSILSGVMLLILAGIEIFGRKSSQLTRWQNKLLQPLIRKFGAWMYRPGGSFILGFLNGILPCGMVYLALISAINAETITDSMSYMLFFGLGTLPLMFLLSLSSFLPIKIPKLNFRKVLPILFVIMGIWFILRGANLGIPYLSPLLHADGAALCK